MSSAKSSATKRRKAQTYYQEALDAYQRWDIDDAIKELEASIALAPDKASYQLTLAQVLSRSGDFDRALQALANYLRLAPDSKATERIEQLFASGMDAVEEHLTNQMTSARMPIELIGAAIQMWIEFRIALGEEQIHIPKPEAWSAALDYTVRKVNLRDIPIGEVAASYNVSAETVRKHHAHLVERLDIMPCDYRYFIEEQNPLDKLVEAAELLEKLEERFKRE